MADTFELLPGTGIQVWRFKGAAPGPKVLITAGIHREILSDGYSSLTKN